MKASTAARTATALIAALVLVTGCASGAPASVGTASPTDSTNPLVKVSYDTWGFTAMRPDAWRSYPFEFIGTLGGTIGYLSTDEVVDPCRRTGDSRDCGQQRVLDKKLSDAGVLVRWGEVGRPGVESISHFPGDPIVVDGSPARLGKATAATDDCRVLGGAVQIEGTVLRANAPGNYVELDACLGTDAGRTAELEVDALFRSIAFLPG